MNEVMNSVNNESTPVINATIISGVKIFSILASSIFTSILTYQ